jgi:group I intron endonuclease
MIVYLVRNLITGKCYVGKTGRTLEQRWKEHVAFARPDSPMLVCRAIAKHGAEQFEVRVLDECDDAGVLNELERLWIKELGTFKPKGYNLTLGGDGMLGWKHTEDAKRRMSLNRSGEKNCNSGKTWGRNLRGWREDERVAYGATRVKDGNPMFGKHHSESARSKIGAATSIRKMKPVHQCDSQTGAILHTYPSLKAAAVAVGGQKNKISEVLRGLHPTHKGFSWRYVTPE